MGNTQTDMNTTSKAEFISKLNIQDNLRNKQQSLLNKKQTIEFKNDKIPLDAYLTTYKQHS